MTSSKKKSEQREALQSSMREAGCVAPADWVASELSEDIPQFARFLLLKGVHEIADDVDSAVAGGLWSNPDAERTWALLQAAVPPDALHSFLRAYAKAVGESIVMLLDYGMGNDAPDDAPGWLLMETRDGETTGRSIEGLHEDYPDFEKEYRR